MKSVPQASFREKVKELNDSRLLLKIYKLFFWLGYTFVLITAMLNINWSLDKQHVHLIAFDLRLDHLLHLGAYFFICMYYLAGQLKGLSLFETWPLLKFILVTVFLAVVTEVVQIWVPARAFNPFDLISNIAGIGIGVIIITIINGKRKKEDLSAEALAKEEGRRIIQD